MGKRKLTKNQKRQLEKNEQNLLEDNNLIFNKGLVISNQGSKILVDFQDKIYSCYAKNLLKTPISGDIVKFSLPNNENDLGVIFGIYPRNNEILRPLKLKGKNKVMASNIDIMLIVISVMPKPIEHYIDRFLIIARYYNINPILIFNKKDLITEQNKQEFLNVKNIYDNLSYKSYFISSFENNDISILKSLIKDKTAIIVGQSGVGKSAIINNILEKEIAKIGDISLQNKKGKHTTNHSYLYKIKNNGKIIDSAGIREFSLTNLSNEDIFNGFIEFNDLQGMCQFKNCNHQLNAKGCIIVEHLKNNKINLTRFNNYHRIIDS